MYGQTLSPDRTGPPFLFVVCTNFKILSINDQKTLVFTVFSSDFDVSLLQKGTPNAPKYSVFLNV